ncbi:MAG TPA: hypothetical protein VFP68_15930 [Burkholderiaceae bacterium]|nr:hypothetical protein [Burkholderiaceae bacterium]
MLPLLVLAQSAVMQTWHPWQLDSVLVAWALSQGAHGKPSLMFESIARGTPIPADRAIDTPDSPYRRSGQRTAFEEAVRLNHVDHPCVARLREAVRVVELAPWRKPELPAVEAFEGAVLKAAPHEPGRGGMEAAFAEVDRYCRGGT